MASDREMRELDSDEEDEDAPKKRRRRNERKKDDVVLDEAMNIVMDIIRLTGGEELPQPKGGWF